MTPNDDLSTSQKTLLNKLAQELFHTETSAARHATREAARLGDSGPSRALRPVAVHAEKALAQLPELARRNDLLVSTGGMLVGAFFSQTRDKLVDVLIDSERSYRGTLLGLRHGIDVVRLLHELVTSTGNTDLEEFCERWLITRAPLVRDVEEQLLWFAQNPEEAVKTASTPSFFGKTLHDTTRRHDARPAE